MEFIRFLSMLLRGLRVFLFGANIVIERMIRVSGGEFEKAWAVEIASREMRSEAAGLLGLEECDFDLYPAKPIPMVAVRPGLWLGDMQELRVFGITRIFGTFYCRRFYSRPLGSDDGRRRLRLEIRAKGLLPGSPFTLEKELSKFEFLCYDNRGIQAEGRHVKRGGSS